MEFYAVINMFPFKKVFAAINIYWKQRPATKLHCIVVFKKSISTYEIFILKKNTQILSAIKAPCFFSGLLRYGSDDAHAQVEEEETAPPHRTPLVPKTSSSIEFTILGLNQENMEAAKAEIDQCCSDEAADTYISGPEFSDIIHCLDPSKVSIDRTCLED